MLGTTISSPFAFPVPTSTTRGSRQADQVADSRLLIPPNRDTKRTNQTDPYNSRRRHPEISRVRRSRPAIGYDPSNWSAKYGRLTDRPRNERDIWGMNGCCSMPLRIVYGWLTAAWNRRKRANPHSAYSELMTSWKCINNKTRARTTGPAFNHLWTSHAGRPYHGVRYSVTIQYCTIGTYTACQLSPPLRKNLRAFWNHSIQQEVPAKQSMERPGILWTPGDWKYIHIEMSTTRCHKHRCLFILPAMDWNPKFGGGVGVTDLAQTYFPETRIWGLTNDTKIVLIGWKVWSQVTSVSDGQWV